LFTFYDYDDFMVLVFMARAPRILAPTGGSTIICTIRGVPNTFVVYFWEAKYTCIRMAKVDVALLSQAILVSGVPIHPPPKLLT
jgi:hypothetical protein